MDVFAANDIAAMVSISGTETSDANYYNATYTNKALIPPFTCPRFINPDTGATVTLADGWMHFDIYPGGSGGSSEILWLQSSAGVNLFRLFSSGTSLRADYWNGTAWVTSFTTLFGGLASLGRSTMDLHWTITGTTISMDVFRNNSIVASSGAVAFAGMANVAKFVTGNGSWSVGVRFSQFLVSDENTVGALIKSLVQNGAGANTAWTGVHTDVEEIAINDATMISSGTAGDKESYTATDATLPTNYHVAGIWQTLRGRNSASSPTGIKAMLRLGGVDYSAAYNFPGLNTASFEGSVACHSLDPSTGLAWSGVTNVNASEIGYEAVA